jgi:predicted lactoylglutathione lyase
MRVRLTKWYGVDMTFPPVVPELPVSDVERASKAYAQQMGFAVDWQYEGTLAGISRDAARIFLRRRTSQAAEQRYSVTIWLNMGSSAEVDELYAVWKNHGVVISDELHTAAYNLREFTAEDVDGNKLRVFYDLGSGRA